MQSPAVSACSAGSRGISRSSTDNGYSHSLLAKTVLYQQWRDGKKSTSWKEVKRLLNSPTPGEKLRWVFDAWKIRRKQEWIHARAEAEADPDAYFREIVGFFLEPTTPISSQTANFSGNSTPNRQ